MGNFDNEEELTINNLPEETPKKWYDICEATAKMHDKDLTPQEITIISNYTWDLFRDTVKLDKSTRENSSTNKNEDIENG